MTLQPLPLLLALTLCATSSQAQVSSALLREGDVLTGAPVGHAIATLGSLYANDNGGFVVQTNTSDGSTTLSHAWGSGNGLSPGVLITESTYGPLVQTSFESFIGIAGDGSVSYSATGTGGPAGGFDSVWVDTVPIAVEGDPVNSLPGLFWRFGSRPGITVTGVPYFVGGTTTTSGGSTSNYGLFYGMDPQPVLLGGQLVPGLPFALKTSSSIGFDYRFSALGTHFIIDVLMDSGSTSTDSVMVVSGQGLILGGSLVQEGSPVPVSAGGLPGENWAIFDYMGINESGDYFFTGDTSGPTATDEFILKNGVIVYREGDTVDGHVLTGTMEAAFMNENGQIVYLWDVVDGTGSLEAIFVDDTLVIREGDEVDWDGDGIVDPGHIVTNLGGLAALAIGPDGTVYFTADVDTTSGNLKGFFSTKAPSTALAYCFGDGSGTVCPCGNFGSVGNGCANSTFTSGALLVASGTASVSSSTLVLAGSGLDPNQSGLYFQGENATNGGLGTLLGDGLRCAGGNIKRIQLRQSSAGGTSQTTNDIALKGGAAPGDTKRYQLWYRDAPISICGTGFNLSNGLEVVWGP